MKWLIIKNVKANTLIFTLLFHLCKITPQKCITRTSIDFYELCSILPSLQTQSALGPAGYLQEYLTYVFMIIILKKSLENISKLTLTNVASGLGGHFRPIHTTPNSPRVGQPTVQSLRTNSINMLGIRAVEKVILVDFRIGVLCH